MGSIIGGVIGGVGSLLGGQSAKSNDLTGYNFLTGANGTSSAVNNGTAANTAESQLLGTAPITSQTQNGFNNYLNSTGYNFQKQQGTSALTGSAAARGILNSGSTAKALTGYGQNLASTSFNNYLSNLSGLSGQGITAAGQIGSAGTQGGTAAGNAQNSAISGAAQDIGGQSSNLLNFFGGL